MGNLDKYYADNARRFDNGMPSELTDGRPFTTKEVRCMLREAKNFQVHPIHIARHSERTGSAEIKSTFSSDRSLLFSAFYDFDHECKIAAEYFNLNTADEDFEWWAEKVQPCF